MTEQPRYVPRMAAEPPQEDLPYGRWAQRLAAEFMLAVNLIESEDELGEPEEITWYPDRSWHGYTYVPATARTSGGFELLGYVRFRAAGDDREPADFSAIAYYTDGSPAEENPAGAWTSATRRSAAGERRRVGRENNARLGPPADSGGQFVAGELAECSSTRAR